MLVLLALWALLVLVTFAVLVLVVMAVVVPLAVWCSSDGLLRPSPPSAAVPANVSPAPGATTSPRRAERRETTAPAGADLEELAVDPLRAELIQLSLESAGSLARRVEIGTRERVPLLPLASTPLGTPSWITFTVDSWLPLTISSLVRVPLEVFPSAPLLGGTIGGVMSGVLLSARWSRRGSAWTETSRSPEAGSNGTGEGCRVGVASYDALHLLGHGRYGVLCLLSSPCLPSPVVMFGCTLVCLRWHALLLLRFLLMYAYYFEVTSVPYSVEYHSNRSSRRALHCCESVRGQGRWNTGRSIPFVVYQ